MLTLPPGLTEEEEALQKRFAKLRKKHGSGGGCRAVPKGAAGAEEAAELGGGQRPGGIKRSMSDQPPLDTATATEQAKLLVKSGAISAIKAENTKFGLQTLPDPSRASSRTPRRAPPPPSSPSSAASRPTTTPRSHAAPRGNLSMRASSVPASGCGEPEGGARGEPPERGERRLDWDPEPEPEERRGARRNLPEVGLVPRAPPPPQGEHSVRARGRAEPRAAARSLRPLWRHHRPLHGHAPQLRLCHLREDGVSRPGHGRAERGRGPGRAAQGQHRPQAAAAGRGHRQIPLGVPGGEEQRQGLAPGQALAGGLQRGPVRGTIKDTGTLSLSPGGGTCGYWHLEGGDAPVVAPGGGQGCVCWHLAAG
ncbi:negative elongation factor E-like [Haemorhous mexicanus]|uniref:negative elongation factor E-like n=1 Tax=Haemorhous mexicanus TaxID=30427 RepID=UPI0028BE9321|nr:negative elongation factor E-like [Haemorhous mexicanus]